MPSFITFLIINSVLMCLLIVALYSVRNFKMLTKGGEEERKKPEERKFLLHYYYKDELMIIEPLNDCELELFLENKIPVRPPGNWDKWDLKLK